jgi:DNA-binding NarL/FixJ family response regulator
VNPALGIGHITQDTRLSAQQQSVLQDVAHGHTYKQISNTRGIALNTVSKYVQVCRRKLGAHSTTHAVAIALRRKIIQ